MKNKIKNNKTVKMLLLLITGVVFVNMPVLAEKSTSVSYSVSCRMPLFITLPNGKKVLAENQLVEEQNLETDMSKENFQDVNQIKESDIEKQNNDLTGQQQDIILKENSEEGVIVTAYAK